MSQLRVDPEHLKFQAELLQSVREYKAGRYVRKAEFTRADALRARTQMALSQSQFALLLGVSIRTLQGWELGRTKPTGAAQTLLRVAIQMPEALLKLR